MKSSASCDRKKTNRRDEWNKRRSGKVGFRVGGRVGSCGLKMMRSVDHESVRPFFGYGRRVGKNDSKSAVTEIVVPGTANDNWAVEMESLSACSMTAVLRKRTFERGIL